MGGGTASDSASVAEMYNEDNLRRSFNVAVPLERSLLGYAKGALDAGEPGYVKSGFGSFQQGLRDQSRRTMESDLHNAFTGRNVPQGGAALGELGGISGTGAGREAAAVGTGRFAESQAMFNQTQNLLDVMSGQAASGLGQSVTAAEQQARAISMMPQVSSTYGTIMGALNAAGSIYGGLNSGPSYGSSGGVMNMTGNPNSVPVSGF